jgi:competence protein ComEA
VLPDGRVVLNTATPKELTTLPGIGQKRAEAIIALRTRLKGFRKLSDLLRVKGIGVKSLKKLEPKVVLDVPAESR